MLWPKPNMWVLWNVWTYVSWEKSKRTCIWVLRSPIVVCCMRVGVCSHIFMLHVILVNKCCVGQLLFNVHCKLSKFINKSCQTFPFLAKTSNIGLEWRFTAHFSRFTLFEFFEFKIANRSILMGFHQKMVWWILIVTQRRKRH